MLELGDHAAKLHAGLAELIKGKNIDLVLLAGPEMKALAEKLADGPKIEYRANVDELKPVLLDTRAGGRYRHDQVIERRRLFQAGRCADQSVSGAGRERKARLSASRGPTAC